MPWSASSSTTVRQRDDRGAQREARRPRRSDRDCGARSAGISRSRSRACPTRNSPRPSSAPSRAACSAPSVSRRSSSSWRSSWIRSAASVARRHQHLLNRGSLELLIERPARMICNSTPPWKDFDRSVAHVATEIDGALRSRRRAARGRADRDHPPGVLPDDARLPRGAGSSGVDCMLPLVIALKNTDGGVLVDAVMIAEADVSIVFSFTRSYFHVDLERVGEAVVFLKSMLPRKPVSELFTVLGRAKQGKTERYRELFRHLQQSDDRIRACARRSRAGDGVLHPALLRHGVQGHPRSLSISQEHPAAGSHGEVRAWFSSTTAPAGSWMRRNSSGCAFRSALFAPELLEELLGRSGRQRARRRRGPDLRSHVHRAAHDAAQSLPRTANHARPQNWRCSTTASASATWPTRTSLPATCC